MKRYLVVFPIFFFTFFTGIVLAPQLRPIEVAVESPIPPRVHIESFPTDLSPIEPAACESQSAEFTELEIDEDGLGQRLALSWGDSVCRSDRPSFPNGTSLVLFKRGDRTSLESTRLNFRSLVQTETSAFFPVEFKNSGLALFLLSDKGPLAPGPVQTLYSEPLNSEIPDDKLFFDGLRIGDRRSFQLGDKNYVIRMSTGPPFRSDPTAVLVLEDNSHTQIIWYGSDNDGLGACELKWVGDLDRDDQLDLMFTYYEQNGGGSVEVLLLSSNAKPGNLVGPVAFSFARDCR